jgi:hypothetical protein
LIGSVVQRAWFDFYHALALSGETIEDLPYAHAVLQFFSLANWLPHVFAMGQSLFEDLPWLSSEANPSSGNCFQGTLSASLFRVIEWLLRVIYTRQMRINDNEIHRALFQETDFLVVFFGSVRVFTDRGSPKNFVKVMDQSLDDEVIQWTKLMPTGQHY